MSTEKEDNELKLITTLYRVKEYMEDALKLVVRLDFKKEVIDEGEKILSDVSSYLKRVRGY